MQTFDLIIIGAGRASNLAVKAGKMGLKVAIIEKSKLGGTCPNRGCVPSKLLIGYAHVARAIKKAHNHAITSHIENIDTHTIFKQTNDYIAQIDPGYASRFNENVTVIKGEASFIDTKVVKVNDQTLSAPKILIATGTRPIKPEHEKAWTSDDIFPLNHPIPSSITVVGSGFIACELANFFDAIGIETTQLVRSQTLLSNEDKDISAIFKKEYTKDVNVKFDTTITQVQYENNQFTMTLNDGSIHQSQALLYATGRVSNADILNLSATGVQVDERGFIKRNEMFETTQEGIYVTGDASGENMLQHAAAYEVNHLGRILLEDCQSPLQFKYMPHAVFTDPEIASVGITEQQAKKQNIEYITTTTSWQASAKALSLRVKYPRTKFIIDPHTYAILGAHMIGPESATMMHQVLAIMHIDNDIRHLKEMLYIHPALSEALLPAAVQAVQKVEEYHD
jgi:dihydrolipoamide dehydrogenase